MIRVSDYVITPNDIAHAFRWRYVVGILVGVGLAIGLGKVGAGPDIALFVSAIVAAVIWKMDARIPFAAAIACFIGIMAASVVAPKSSSDQGSLREQLAVAAFYCLVIGVALLIREQFAPRRKRAKKAQPAVAAQTAASTPIAARPAPRSVPAPAAPYVIPANAGIQSKYSAAPAAQQAFKPHLAPHPMLLKPQHTGSGRAFPAPTGQAVREYSQPGLALQHKTPQPLPKSRIIDVMRPAPSRPQHIAPRPHRPHPRLVQL